jgi:hypothetical protein
MLGVYPSEAPDTVPLLSLVRKYKSRLLMFSSNERSSLLPKSTVYAGQGFVAVSRSMAFDITVKTRVKVDAHLNLKFQRAVAFLSPVIFAAVLTIILRSFLTKRCLASKRDLRMYDRFGHLSRHS